MANFRLFFSCCEEQQSPIAERGFVLTNCQFLYHPRMPALKGVPSNISPELMHTLMSMGHGDEIGMKINTLIMFLKH